MTNPAKVGTVLAAAACLVLLPSFAANAQSGNAAVRQACRAQVKVIWPNVNREEQRTRNDVFRACVNNGGRVPG